MNSGGRAPVFTGAKIVFTYCSGAQEVEITQGLLDKTCACGGYKKGRRWTLPKFLQLGAARHAQSFGGS